MTPTSSGSKTIQAAKAPNMFSYYYIRYRPMRCIIFHTARDEPGQQVFAMTQFIPADYMQFIRVLIILWAEVEDV